MTTQVIHIRNAPKAFKNNPDYVFIGRGSIWGNPYRMRKCPTLKNKSLPQAVTEKIAALYAIQERQRVINAYHAYLNCNADLQAHLHELRDKILVCYCSPEACHGDILIKAVENLQYETVAQDRLNDLDYWLAV